MKPESIVTQVEGLIVNGYVTDDQRESVLDLIYEIAVERDDLRARAEKAEAALAAERSAVVAALRAWAEDGGDPWMAHCADRIAAGEHLTRAGDL
jgi:hypothetical protein